MKSIRALLLCIIPATVFVSCQKSYMPDPVVAGSGGTGSSTGTVLSTYQSKTVGSSESSTSTYEYDGSSRVIKITSVDVDSSNNSITTVYRYVRDVSGKITSVVTNSLAANSPGSGFPDSVYVNVNYPSGSSAYNFTSYAFSVGSVPVKDSIGYLYTGSTLTDVYEYQAISTTTFTVSSRIQYIYSNGNIVTEKIYLPATTGGALTLAGTYAFDYDSKTSPLITGNESFLPGQNFGYACKNNPVKFVATDNSTNSVFATLNYTYQYNSSGLPISGTVVQTPGNKTTTLTLSYR